MTQRIPGLAAPLAFAVLVLLILPSCARVSQEATGSGSDSPATLLAAAAGDYDPASADPVHFDRVNPPRIAETVFRIEGADLNAIVYQAQGAGPHPTAILLHGFPGNEKNLDLAQAMRRAGWNVVFFHYRGSWGSGGRFSFAHVLEDVAGVVNRISEPEFARSHRINPDRLALVGHSMGGFAAWVSGAELDSIDCIVSIAGGNLGGLARVFSASAAQGDEGVRAMAATLDGWSGPLQGTSGAKLIEEILGSLERFDTINHAEALGRKRLLLLAGGRDEVTPVSLHHLPMVEALRATGSRTFVSEVFEEADHSFSGQRIALARRVTRWLGAECRAHNE